MAKDGESLPKKERLQKKRSCHSAGHGQYTIETFKVSTLRRHLHSAICHYHLMAWINVQFWQRDQMQPQSAHGPGGSDWDKTRQRETTNANIKNTYIKHRNRMQSPKKILMPRFLCQETSPAARSPPSRTHWLPPFLGNCDIEQDFAAAGPNIIRLQSTRKL